MRTAQSSVAQRIARVRKGERGGVRDPSVTHHRNEQNSARRSGGERLRYRGYLVGAPGLEPGTS
jgi:hypothetical protein